MSSPRLRAAAPLFAAAVTVVLWASAFGVVRGLGETFSPGSLALGRQVVGTVALSVVIAIQSIRRGTPPRLPRGRLLLGVVVWGVAQFGLYTLSFNSAERYLDAGTTSLLVNIAPVIVALLAGLLLKEGFPRRLLIGLAIAFTGVAIIATTSSSGGGSVLGVVLGIAAAVIAAVGIVGQKRLLAKVDPLTLTWIGCASGILPCLPFAPELVSQVAVAPSPHVLWVLYLGLFPTSIAFFTWAFALQRTRAGRLAASTYAVPPLVVLMSWIALAEVPPPLVFVGGALCLTGVAIATLRGSRPRTAEPTTPAGAREPVG